MTVAMPQPANPEAEPAEETQLARPDGPQPVEPNVDTGLQYPQLTAENLSPKFCRQVDEVANSCLAYFKGEHSDEKIPYINSFFKLFAENLSPTERDYLDRKLAAAIFDEIIQIVLLMPQQANMEVCDYSVVFCQQVLEDLDRIMEQIKLPGVLFRDMIGGLQNHKLNRIIRSIHHDLNNDLVVPTVYLDLLAKSDDSSAGEAKKFLQENWDSIIFTTLQTFLANEALVLGTFDFEDFNLRNALYGVLQKMKRRNADYENSDGSELQVEIDPALLINGSSSAIALAVYNLLKNPSTILHGVEIPIVLSATSLGENYLEILVRDHGIGIEIPQGVDEKEYCRDLFTWGNSHSGSSGIGLAFVKTVIDGHGGDVSIRNHPEGGAEVRIILPNISEKDLPARRRTTQQQLVREQITA